MAHTPTAEQQAIIDAAVKTSDNLIIVALAGAAKTTTLEMICSAVRGIPILSLAFNKRIVEEMTKRLPSHVQCATMNSLGHRAWAAATGKRLIIEKDKNYNELKKYIDELPTSERGVLYDQFTDIKKAIAKAKLSGYLPEAAAQSDRTLITWEEFDLSFEEALPTSWKRVIDAVLLSSIKAAYAGVIDFDDQIYMPTLYGATFQKFPLVLIDEAQDLSPLNHAMLAKLVTKRLIAVGDPFQSIYGFRGSVSDGMSVLERRFNMRRMTLSTSFRCPKAVVALARERAPNMNYPEWAIEGLVTFDGLTAGEEVPEDYTSAWSPVAHSAIICRNNAPLFSLALALIRNGRSVKLLGNDIGPGLIKILKSLGDESTKTTEALDLLEAWKVKQERKTRALAALYDKVECLKVFIEVGTTLGGAVAYADMLFKQEGTILLMSGHKSKGLEFDVVYHLDPWRVPSPFAKEGEQMTQELNLRYVITTRAKKELHHVNTEDYEEPGRVGAEADGSH